jgi:hypothetical protein
MAQHSEKIEPAGLASINATADWALGTNRDVLHSRPNGVPDKGAICQVPMPGVKKERASGKAGDVAMTKTATTH